MVFSLLLLLVIAFFAITNADYNTFIYFVKSLIYILYKTNFHSLQNIQIFSTNCRTKFWINSGGRTPVDFVEVTQKVRWVLVFEIRMEHRGWSWQTAPLYYLML